MVGCLLFIMAWIYGMGLGTSARCVVWSLVVVRMAIEPKYRNTPQSYTDINMHTKNEKLRHVLIPYSTNVHKKNSQKDFKDYSKKQQIYDYNEVLTMIIYVNQDNLVNKQCS